MQSSATVSLRTPMTPEEAAVFASRLGAAVRRRAGELCGMVANESGRSHGELLVELETTAGYLERSLARAAAGLSGRRAICTEEEWACLMLPSNISVGAVGLIAALVVAGNRVLARFPSRAAGSAGVIEEMFAEAAAGIVVVDRAASGPEFVERIWQADDIRYAHIFGGEALGDELLERCRSGVQKRIVFEGPGKDPFIVLRGALIGDAADILIKSKFMISGQTCVAPENIIVHRTLHDDLVERLVAACERALAGDMPDPAAAIAPMISPRVPPIVRAQLDDAREKGARTVCGGSIEGQLVEPTVVTGVTEKMSLFQDETFAPVFAVVGFDGESEAVDLARAGRFGLVCRVFGPDPERVAAPLRGEPYAHPVDDLVYGRYGHVRLDAGVGSMEPLRPFGGYAKSGWIWDGDGLRQGPKSPAIEATVPLS